MTWCNLKFGIPILYFLLFHHICSSGVDALYTYFLKCHFIIILTITSYHTRSCTRTSHLLSIENKTNCHKSCFRQRINWSSNTKGELFLIKRIHYRHYSDELSWLFLWSSILTIIKKIDSQSESRLKSSTQDQSPILAYTGLLKTNLTKTQQWTRYSRTQKPK